MLANDDGDDDSSSEDDHDDDDDNGADHAEMIFTLQLLFWMF